MDDSLRVLTAVLRERKRRIIPVEELQAMAGESDYLRFHRLISGMVHEGILRPVDASGHNGRSPVLFNRYRLVREDPPERPFLEEISTLPIDRAVRYYRRHPEHYSQDRAYVQAICGFLLGGDVCPLVTTNERSYQLFRDEKALKDGRGGTVLERMGLGLDDLRVIPTSEPFVHFDLRHSGGDERVLIVENLDSFISVHRCLRGGVPLLGKLMPGVIIYGEGNKILSSFQFVREVPGLGESARYLYFGDLDHEGISIYRRLVSRYDGFDIRPWVVGYLGLLQVEPDPPVGRDHQRKAALCAFLEGFPEPQARQIEEMLASGRYIPQEALSLAHMTGDIPLEI